MSQPVVEGSLGSPPFEKPNIEQVSKKIKAFSGHSRVLLIFVALVGLIDAVLNT